MQINNIVYKYLDYELSQYKKYKAILEIKRKDIMDASPPPADGQPKGSHKSDPTLEKVIELNTPRTIMRMQYIKNCVEEILKKMDKEHKKFFEENYIKTNGCNMIKVCNTIAIGERTYYRMKRKIIEAVACEIGII